MNPHPYLRAYMGGIVVPSLFMLLVLSAFSIARYGWGLPVPIERVIIFPMAIVPNVFGLWNIFFLWLRPRRHLPIGLHGAVLPFLIAPLGVGLARGLGLLAITPQGFLWLGAFLMPYHFLALAFFFALTVYYLVWKYFVCFFNEVLGIA